MNFLKNTASFELDNGFRLFFLHRNGPGVEMQIHVATGSVHEGKFLGHGLSHFLEHMLFQGCQGYPGHAVADTVTSLGGDLNAYTGCDRTCYRMTLPRESWRQGIDMLSSMVRFPELPAERFIREKEVILRECERSMDNVSSRMLEKFLRTMFISHPLRHPVIGYRDLIAKVSCDMAREYHDLRYTPDRSFAVIVGNASADEVFQYIGEKFGSWERKNLENIILPQEDVPVGGRSAELIFNDPVNRLMWGVQAPEFGSPLLPAADVLFGMLGTGEGAILNTEMVIGSRSALNARSFCFPLGNCSLAGVSVETEPRNFKRAEKELSRILENCASGKISAAGMKREKGQQFADRLRGLRNILNVAAEIAEGVYQTGDPGAGDRFVEQLQTVDIDTVRQVAEMLLGSNRWIKVRQFPEAKGKSVSITVKKPELVTRKLSSGLRMIAAPDNSLPLCCMTLILPGGTIYEKAGKSGISQLCAAMICSRTAEMSETAVLKKLDELCIDIDVSSGSNSLMLDISVPKRKFQPALEFISTLLRDAEFTPEIFERERNYLIEQLKVRSNHPVKAAFDRAGALLYGTHPYSAGTVGKIADLQTLSLSDVKEFYHSLLDIDCAAIGIGGDCSVNEAVHLAEKFVSVLDFRSGAAATLPEKPQFPASVCRENFTLKREQTVAIREIPGAALDDIDTVNALEILSSMENGLGSKLFKVVREDNALSYSVGMTFSSGFHPGIVSFYAMTTPGAGEQVLELFEAEIQRLACGNFSDEEFDSARRSAAFDCELHFNKPESLLRTALLDEYYGFDAGKCLEKSELLRHFPKEKFIAALKKLFTAPTGCSILVLPE